MNWLITTIPTALLFAIGQTATVALRDKGFLIQIVACIPFWMAAEYYAWRKARK